MFFICEKKGSFLASTLKPKPKQSNRAKKSIFRWREWEAFGGEMWLPWTFYWSFRHTLTLSASTGTTTVTKIIPMYSARLVHTGGCIGPTVDLNATFVCNIDPAGSSLSESNCPDVQIPFVTSLPNNNRHHFSRSETPLHMQIYFWSHIAGFFVTSSVKLFLDLVNA
jgi:hypothetical protein